MNNILKKIRKLFNLLSKKEIEIIELDNQVMKSIAKKLADEHNDSERKIEKKYNNICPNCRSKKIVNKISNVSGEGNISGSLFWFDGDSYVGTKEVNHCSECGNQWKKYESDFYSTESVIADWINDLFSILESHKNEAIKIFNDNNIHAESIWRIYNKKLYYRCYYKIGNKISLSLLRKSFKSMYDE